MYLSLAGRQCVVQTVLDPKNRGKNIFVRNFKRLKEGAVGKTSHQDEPRRTQSQVGPNLRVLIVLFCELWGF